MASWTEVRELAAQLKAAQEKASVLRLSERTWVDIVRHLTNTNRLKLIYTTDGRSYLTKEELQKEIREEVEAHNGRISLTELASNLDVDTLIIEARINDMILADTQAKSADRLISIPGEVINETYVRQVAHDIQDRLEERGEVTIGELATVFALPTTFLLNILTQYQGVLFRVQKYDEKYITDACMTEHRAKVRGYFNAVMRPITLSSAASKLNIPESLLSGIVGSLIACGDLSGSLMAGRGTYVPTCYTRAQDSYVRSFYAQNGYVEWTYLKRLGTPDPASYLRSLLPNAVHLSGVSIGQLAIDHLKAVVEEATNDGTWADLSHYLPPGLNVKDRLTLVTGHTKNLPVHITEDGLFAVSEQFVNNCMKYFEKLINERAEVAAREKRQENASSHIHNGTVETFAETSKRSTQSSKGGFGMGAREIKTKNVKKKYNPSKRRVAGGQANMDAETYESDIGDFTLARYIPIDELNELLTAELSDVPVEVISCVVTGLLPQLERTFNTIVDSVFLPNSDTTRRKETVAHTQEVVNNMLFAIQLMERGISGITRPTLQTQLTRHLIKTHGTCLVDKLCLHLAQYFNLDWPTISSNKKTAEQEDTNKKEAEATSDSVNPLSPEQRQHFLELLKRSAGADAASAATALQNVFEKMRAIQQISGINLKEYYDAVETLATEHAGISLPTLHTRADNKRKRDEKNKANELGIQVELQLHSAVEDLQNDTALQSAAKATLAAACLFSQVATGWPITAPGKCVPELVSWLVEFVSSTNSSEIQKSPALQALANSAALSDLSSLTARISQHMHSGVPPGFDTALKNDFQTVVEVAKQCRKLLSS